MTSARAVIVSMRMRVEHGLQLDAVAARACSPSSRRPPPRGSGVTHRRAVPRRPARPCRAGYRSFPVKGCLFPYGAKGDRVDNGATEQVSGHMKDELFKGVEWPSFEEFERSLDAYAVHWDTRRRQVKLKGLTPEEFRNQSLCAA